MSENDGASRTAIEQKIAKEFEAAKYEVSQSVGMLPGEVDWFARPRTGLERPTTYWQVWNACPEELDEALLALEATRTEKGADRALAVMNGELPAGYAADLRGSSSNAITVNRLIIELRGIADQVRTQKARYEAEGEPAQFFSRKGRTSGGDIVDAVGYVKTWLQGGAGKSLAVKARQYSGRSSLIGRVAYELSIEFERDPENVIPLVLKSANLGRDAATLDVRDKGVRTVQVVDAISDETKEELPSAESVLDLLEPADSDVEDWIKQQSLAPDVVDQFRLARNEVAEFKSLSNRVPNLSPILTLIRRSLPQASKDAKEWMAEVVSSYVEAQLSRPFIDVRTGARPGAEPTRLLDCVSALEDAAFQQFALGETAPSHALADAPTGKSLLATLSTWLVLGPSATVRIEGKYLRRQPIIAFSNSLVRDYFVARKIAREIAAGNSAILARYQFPKDYVLLFLATLSPSAAAQATAERSAEIRAEIEAEVERRLQLTLAHQLKRSAGAVRASLRSIRKAIQKKMTPEDAETLGYDIGRIDEEAVFQSALAEQTRLWREVPEGAVESLVLAEHVVTIVEPLRERYPAVRCEVSVDLGILVRANRSGIREILHGLIENAFHAAPLGKNEAPFVRVVAVAEGKSTRLDVIDSGPGIRPEDRDRVFEPYVTTKKGGDQPLGTGMGLVIARRYAQRVGARVDIAMERQETCFFVRFVTGEEKV